MSTSTYAVERVQFLQELDVGFQIPNASITALAAGSFTAPLYLLNANWGSSQLANRQAGAFRPTTATAADVYRPLLALTNSSGLHTITGANYTDTTLGTETIEIWYYGIRPDTDVLNAYNRAIGDIYDHAWEPLTLALDPGCRDAALANWGVAVNATAAKQSTAGSYRVFPGLTKSVAVTNTSTNGYQPTLSIPVVPTEQLVIIGLSRVQSGTASQMVVWDSTNGAAISTVTHQDSVWQFSVAITSAPAGCHNITVRLGGTGASDVTDWQTPWVYRPQANALITLPSGYLDEQFKVESVAYTTFHNSVAPNASGLVYQAMAQDPITIPGTDYSPDVMATAANPSFIQFHGGCEGYFQYPLWVQVRLPYLERGAVSAETDVVYAPRHLLLPAWKRRLLESVSMQKRIPDGAQVWAKADAFVAAHQRARTTEGPSQKERSFQFFRVA